MFVKFTSFFGFMFCLNMGMLLSLSSYSWFGVWMGLELNLLSFLPIIMMSKMEWESESAIKYFIVQASGSLILLQASFFFPFSSFWGMIMILCLVYKSGGAPFHFWLLNVSEGLEWSCLGLLLTLQKVAPIAVMSYLYSKEFSILFIILVILGTFVGAVGGLNELYLRKLLSFSAVSHFGWILFGMGGDIAVWFLYFLVYCSILLSIVYLFWLNGINHLSQINYVMKSWVYRINISLLFMSMGGFPPLVGFFGKLMVVNYAFFLYDFYIVIMVVLISVVSLYYYIRVSVYMGFMGTGKGAQWSLDVPLFIILYNLVGLFMSGVIVSSMMLY